MGKLSPSQQGQRSEQILSVASLEQPELESFIILHRTCKVFRYSQYQSDKCSCVKHDMLTYRVTSQIVDILNQTDIFRKCLHIINNVKLVICCIQHLFSSATLNFNVTHVRKYYCSGKNFQDSKCMCLSAILPSQYSASLAEIKPDFNAN